VQNHGAYGWPWKVASGPVRLVTQTSFGSAEGKVRTSTCAIPPKRPAFSAALRSSSARPHQRARLDDVRRERGLLDAVLGEELEPPRLLSRVEGGLDREEVGVTEGVRRGRHPKLESVFGFG